MQSREEYLEYQRQYRITHREEIRAKDRVRYQKNKEYHREYQKEYQKKYRKNNKDKIKQYYKEHYVSKKKTELITPTSDNVLEVWKDINEYYLVSNYGKVWSKKTNRLVGHKNGAGYMEVLIDNKVYLIHRLVAEAFIPNPDNLPEIDHLDTDRTNNVWTNLRWTDRKGNQNNPITKRKMKESNKRKADKGVLDKAHKAVREKRSWVKAQRMGAEANRKRVFQYTVDGVFVKEHSSTVEAAKEVGCSNNSIGSCCRGKCKTIKGFVWKYAS